MSDQSQNGRPAGTAAQEPSPGQSGRYRPAAADIPCSLQPSQGWHCSHFYYTWDRPSLYGLDPSHVNEFAEEFQEILDPAKSETERLFTGVTVGDKADFHLMAMGPDPIKNEMVHQRLMSSGFGQFLHSAYSFVSMSELSEYVMSEEQFGDKLVSEGIQRGSDTYQKRLGAYAQRLPVMNEQRLTPVIPDWPVSCFYPMNKSRNPGANWFDLPFSRRNEMMSEHARSGITFMGKVKQLITVGCGIEDWEWGVTLWAKNPEYLKQIVYQMRFDKASALYAEFGPFYTTYQMDAAAILKHNAIIS